MALVKRTVILAGTLAAMTLAGCAPAGYNADDASGAEAQPVANAAAEASASPEAAAEAPSDVKLTDQLVNKSVARMGKVVTDGEGWTLYRFDKDTNKPPATNCAGECAKIWPPALTDGNPALSGIASDKVGTVNRQDGTKQLTLDGWPVYRYAGDEKPGQWKGQGVGGTWFVVAPDGKKNLSCLPTGTPKAVAPPAESGTGGDSGASSGGYTY
ncbi:hypothetical protein [Micromonospora sp. NPDC049679]|uniref:hypothetical protein n=1 Tax=Micromonospora sp. NPDC049679 TaxID=3155920 RepID=UPI003410A4DB